jgi:branched-chain amino acid aminotransferase
VTISIDGRIVRGAAASVSVLDHGFLYGDGVFEGMRVYGRRLFRLDDHLRRLAVSARGIGLVLPGGIAALRRIVLETARAANADEAYVRLVVTRGDGPLGVDPAPCRRPRVVCIVDMVELFPETRARRGVALATASRRRPAADVLDPRVKSLNYLTSVLSKREARARGADDALLLGAAGHVAEATGANVFVVRGEMLLTPPPTDGALEGVTRATILELAPGLGLTVAERSLGHIDLLAADEAFLTGTAARVVPVRSLDGERIGTKVPGPVTTQVREAFLVEARRRGVAFDPTPRPAAHVGSRRTARL